MTAIGKKFILSRTTTGKIYNLLKIRKFLSKIIIMLKILMHIVDDPYKLLLLQEIRHAAFSNSTKTTNCY